MERKPMRHNLKPLFLVFLVMLFVVPNTFAWTKEIINVSTVEPTGPGGWEIRGSGLISWSSFNISRDVNITEMYMYSNPGQVSTNSGWINITYPNGQTIWTTPIVAAGQIYYPGVQLNVSQSAYYNISIGSLTGGADKRILYKEPDPWLWNNSAQPALDFFKSGYIVPPNHFDDQLHYAFEYIVFYSADAPPAPQFTKNISIISPINNTYNNTYNITFELKANWSNVYILNYSIWTNSSGMWKVNQSNTTALVNNTATDLFTINYTKDGHYLYNVQICDNNTNCSFNEYNFTLVLDTVMPGISVNYTNLTLSVFDLLQGQFNFSDANYIHSLNITIPSEDIIIFNRTNITQPLYIYNLSYNTSNLINGEYTLQFEVSDGHTAEKLKEDYDVDTGILYKNTIKYTFPDKGYIKTSIKDGGLFDVWESEKKEDKYIQKLKLAKEKDTITFIEESDMPIYIYNKPGSYKDYWIVTGNHWKDYVIPDEPGSKVSIKQINPYMVEVTVSGIKNNKEEIIFNSVGDLNLVYYNFTFAVAKGNVSYSSVVTELEEQTIILTINTTGINTTTADFYYNGTLNSSTKTSYVDRDVYTATFTTNLIGGNLENYSFNWVYNVSTDHSSEWGNLSFNQTVSKLLLDNCSTYTVIVLNITSWNSTAKTRPVNSSLEAYFRVWVNSMEDYREFNLTWNSNKTHRVCISDNTTYNAYAQLEYSATGFDTGHQFIENTTLSNATQDISLYLTYDTSLVTFDVTDQDDDVVPNVLINILQYDFGTNSYVTTEILKTNEIGEAIGHIVLNDMWYKFLLVYNEEGVLETDPIKITSTTRSFRINLLSDVFSHFSTLNGISTSLIFTNATQNFAYTWVNPTGTSVEACLEVFERTSLQDIPINYTCVSSSGGTILSNIRAGTNLDGRTFVGKGTISINPIFFTDMEIASWANDFKDYGQTGIFLATFIRISLALVGIWNPLVAVILVVLADIGLVVTGLYHLTWEALIAYIIVAITIMVKIGRD